MIHAAAKIFSLDASAVGLLTLSMTTGWFTITSYGSIAAIIQKLRD